MSTNVVVISGALGKDPEHRQTQGGSSVLSFSVAVGDRRKVGEKWEDVTHWVDVVLFGKRADSLAGILRKGMKVTVSGKLSQNRWEDKQGNKRSKLEVVALDVDLPPRQKGEQTNYTGGYQNGPQNGSQQPTGGNYGGYQEEDVYSSDIPF